MELRPAMPTTQYQISTLGGAFICFARALVFKGSALTYDPTCDLSSMEERSALALCYLVLHDEEKVEERMDRFGERRDTGNVVGGGTKENPSQETPCAEASHDDEMEMEKESGNQVKM